MLRALGVAACLVVIAALACGGPNLPAPDYTSHPTSALVEVPYPPPPARAEAIPKRPKTRAVWIDGEWTWQRRWAWKPGRWLAPPAGARFAPWTTVRDRTGTLYFSGGAWRDDAGNEVQEPAPLATGAATAAAVVSPEGEEVEQGAPASLDGGGGSTAARDASGSEAIEALDASRMTLDRNDMTNERTDPNARESMEAGTK